MSTLLMRPDDDLMLSAKPEALRPNVTAVPINMRPETSPNNMRDNQQ